MHAFSFYHPVTERIALKLYGKTCILVKQTVGFLKGDKCRSMPWYADDTNERIALYRTFSSLFMNAPDENTIFEMRELFGMQSQEPPAEIRADFQRIVRGSDLRILPYESLHHYPDGENPKITGKAVKDAESFYSSAGLVIDEGSELAPDHLSAELLFMSYLIESGRVKEQNLFMREHLHAWVPLYCSSISEAASTVFYREVADLLKEFIESEYELMEK